MPASTRSKTSLSTEKSAGRFAEWYAWKAYCSISKVTKAFCRAARRIEPQPAERLVRFGRVNQINWLESELMTRTLTPQDGSASSSMMSGIFGP